MLDVDAALTFTHFVTERHRIWEKRRRGESQPWTDDPILSSKKFTAVFRVLDYGTQFLIRELLDPALPPRDVLMRCFLYRHTGNVAAWEYLGLTMGYPAVTDLDEVLRLWMKYRGRTTTTLSNRKSGTRLTETKFDRTVFTSAYLVFPQSQIPGTDKVESILDLTKRLFSPDSPTDIVPDFLAARTQAERFAVLRRNKGVGDFMSYQILTDWGYSAQCGEDREDEFVIAGPGARKGTALLNPGAKPEDTVRWAQEMLHASPDCPTVGRRLPSLADCQNLACEFFKYSRWMSKPVSGKPYKPAHPGPQPAPTLPSSW